MECGEAKSLLSQVLDGEASAAQVVALDDHLEVCAGCAAERRAYEEIRRVLSGGRSTTAPPDLWGRIETAAEARPRPARGRIVLLRLAACFAGVAASLLFGAALHSTRPRALAPHVDRFVADRLNLVHAPLSLPDPEPLFPEIEQHVIHGHGESQ